MENIFGPQFPFWLGDKKVIRLSAVSKDSPLAIFGNLENRTFRQKPKLLVLDVDGYRRYDRGTRKGACSSVFPGQGWEVAASPGVSWSAVPPAALPAVAAGRLCRGRSVRRRRRAAGAAARAAWPIRRCLDSS